MNCLFDLDLLKELGLPWWLRNLKIHLQRGRPKFDPRIGKILCRREQLTTYSSIRRHISWFKKKLAKENKARGIILLAPELYYKAVVLKQYGISIETGP